MSVSDLIRIPIKPERTTTRRAPKKAPNWHLTSQESMEFIEESNKRTEEKQSKKEKEDKIKKEAVKQATTVENQAKKKKK